MSARIIDGPRETLTVCHCFVEAVRVLTQPHCLACAKQWHTAMNNPGQGGTEGRSPLVRAIEMCIDDFSTKGRNRP